MSNNPMNTPAPAGQVYVCGACGKRSRTKAGFDGAAIDRGWDSSCFLHAVLCYEEKDGEGNWQAVEGGDDAK